MEGAWPCLPVVVAATVDVAWEGRDNKSEAGERMVGDGDGDNGDGVKIMVLLGVFFSLFLGIHLKQRLNMADFVGRHLIREGNSPNGDGVDRMALW